MAFRILGDAAASKKARRSEATTFFLILLGALGLIGLGLGYGGGTIFTAKKVHRVGGTAHGVYQVSHPHPHPQHTHLVSRLCSRPPSNPRQSTP